MNGIDEDEDDRENERKNEEKNREFFGISGKNTKKAFIVFGFLVAVSIVIIAT